jgi:ubiquinone/menaquinone biosynthesis C-methylase UbiE
MTARTNMLRYNFLNIENCNMCGSEATTHKILGQRLNTSQGWRPKNKKGISVTVMRCTNCGLIYSNPLPIPVDIQDHYGVPPEEYWIPDYFKHNENYFSHELETLKKLLPVTPGMKALDIGAGLGKTMISLEKAGFEAYGLEPSTPFYEKAVSVMKIDPDRLKLGMLADIDYPENTFSFITFSSVLEHVYDPAASLQKALKWLKPGGLIHIEVPSAKWLPARFYNIYYKLRGTSYVTNISPMHSPYHLYEFALKSFEEYSKKADCEIAFHEFFEGAIYFLPKFFHPLLHWYMKRTRTGMELIVWLRKK